MFDVKPIVSPKSNDCGATCLQMLLAYYGIEVSLETLTKECNTGFNGCTAGDIMRAGRKHGLNDIKSFSMDAAEVVRQDRPSIVWWKYRHFCVSICPCMNRLITKKLRNSGAFSIMPFRKAGI